MQPQNSYSDSKFFGPLINFKSNHVSSVNPYPANVENMVSS